MLHGYRIVMTAVACVLCAASSLAAAAPGSAPADAKDLVPPEWGGIWSVHLDTYKCSNDSLLYSSTAQDTICPNQPFPIPSGGGLTITCTSTVTTTSFSLHCTGSEQVLPGCTASIVVDLSGTLSGDTYSATGTTNVTYTGSCLGIPNSCTRVVQSGTRIAPAPSPCGHSGAEEQSWGEVKSRYR